MATLAELRKVAKAAGISASVIRGAETAKELQSIMSDAKSHSKSDTKKSGAKKSGGAVVAKKKSGSSKKSNSKPKAPAKKSGAKPAAKKAGSKKSNSKASVKKSNAKASSDGKNFLDGVDFSVTDGWNPREGSGPYRIVKLLKKFKGNRTKVFNAIVDAGELWEFVEKKNSAGTKRSKDQAEAYLRYRISKTAWDFGVKTGQHKASNKRAEYGTAGTSNNDRERFGMAQRKAKKSAGKKANSNKSSAKKSGAKKSGDKKNATAKKAGRKISGASKRKVDAKKAGRAAAKKK